MKMKKKVFLTGGAILLFSIALITVLTLNNQTKPDDGYIPIAEKDYLFIWLK